MDFYTEVQFSWKMQRTPIVTHADKLSWHNLSCTVGGQFASFDDIIVILFSNLLFQFCVELKFKK